MVSRERLCFQQGACRFCWPIKLNWQGADGPERSVKLAWDSCVRVSVKLIVCVCVCVCVSHSTIHETGEPGLVPVLLELVCPYTITSFPGQFQVLSHSCGVFSPQLWDKIWDWPGNEAVLQVCTHTQFLPPTVPWLAIGWSWSLIYVAVPRRIWTLFWLPCSKRCSAELPLRVGLIHHMYTYPSIHASSLHVHCMSPTFNGSFVLQHFECGNAVELCNGIMFDFYPGLPHMVVTMLTV